VDPLDFVQVATKELKGGVIELRPDFIVKRSKDLMVQGQSFYAVWDESAGLWSRDEYELRRLVDEMLYAEAEKLKGDGVECVVKPLSLFSNGGWKQFKTFIKNISDNSHPLDTQVTFANTPVKRNDYVSRRLSYALAEGEMAAYNELISKLYTEEERRKFEWAIGAIIEGDAKKIQKFLVFFGPGGTGKSTVMDIIMLLFGGLVKAGGYVSTFVAKDLVGNNNAFSTEAFKDNPLVAIQQDGDLSRIEDNSKLNSVVSHDDMRINEKYKSTYDSKINAFLFMGTNKPVKITDSKSGLIRRLIDINPTGVTHDPKRYHQLMAQIPFELGAIAYHCHQTYLAMGRSFYNGYEPRQMMLNTDVFYNYVEWYHDVFKKQDGVALKQAWDMYKAFCTEMDIHDRVRKPMHEFREELKGYFESFEERMTIDGIQIRKYYSGFKVQKFKSVTPDDPKKFTLVLEESQSLFDLEMLLQPAQYGNADENPMKYWTDEKRWINGVFKKPRKDQVSTTQLGDLDTSQLHFVKVPENHIVIDFDLKGRDGQKSRERNLEAAAEWPPTYAEFSKSGNGVHLHYIYDGDVSELARVYSDGIEIKVYTGNASLRRRLSFCNNVPVAHLNSGLPFKEKKPVLEMSKLRSAESLRAQVEKEMKTKATHTYTKPTVDWIKKLLDDAYVSGMEYDFSDLRNGMIVLANNSTNSHEACMKQVLQMKFKSEPKAENGDVPDTFKSADELAKDSRIVFFDVEVYPNLFMICWKFAGPDNPVVTMINPTPAQVRELFEYKLVGFNNRGYDNHILYGAHLGKNNAELYELSHKIVNGVRAQFMEAYNLSYADAWEFAAGLNKKALKKWEIELGLPHVEMDLSWDEPAPKERWEDIAKYCANDVMALEAVFDHLQADWIARQIVTDLSGLTEMHTNPAHAQAIIFGKERNPQRAFVYTDLSTEFPGYKYDPYKKTDKSMYRGESVGEGGYVYAEKGIYHNVAVLDVESMHPHSIKALNLFGPYTEKFVELMEARLALKHTQNFMKEAKRKPNDAAYFLRKAKASLEEARTMMDGKLTPHLVHIDVESSDPAELKGISDALKLVINTVYGLTAASYENAFRDPRNIDNIVAKRGALFMVDLKHFVQERGFKVIHIKTDSIKIPDATPEIISEVMKFGEKYGYTFEHEETYDRICLVNDAVYIAKKSDGSWTATGAQFKQPYVFKTLFSRDPIVFNDLCETKQVKDVMYLDHNEDEATPATPFEGMTFIGKTGSFVPVTPEMKGARLVRYKDGKFTSVQGAKGYDWLEADMIRQFHGDALGRMRFENLDEVIEGTGSIADIVDMSYFDEMAQNAIKTIDKFGRYEDFVAA
jgi:hypothetical protein